MFINTILMQKLLATIVTHNEFETPNVNFNYDSVSNVITLTHVNPETNTIVGFERSVDLNLDTSTSMLRELIKIYGGNLC